MTYCCHIFYCILLLSKRNEVSIMDYEIVTLKEKTVVGFSAKANNTSPDMGDIIGNLWKSFYSENGYSRIPDKANDKALGIYTDYEQKEMGNYTIIVACEVINSLHTPKDFMIRTIPAGNYAKFIVRGNMITAVAEFWQKLWRMELKRTFLYDFEEYQNGDCENAEIHIYIGIE